MNAKYIDLWILIGFILQSAERPQT
jgi:hypothetical protein